MKKKKVIHNLNYNQITDQIYIGTNMCCQHHFDERLLNKGIMVDFSLEEERLDAPFGVDYFFWLPTKDHTPPTQDQLEIGVVIIDKCVKMKKKIFVHCKNGHGRAPTMVAAYFISKGKSVDEAVEMIRKKRPEIHLEKSQLKALVLYSKKK